MVPSGGTYYIRVYYGDACNTYQLWWDDVTSDPCATDDQYEENDTRGTAYDWSGGEGTWITAKQNDDDWYRIAVTSGYERVLVDCRFTDADGDIDIQLFDSGGGLLASSASTSDDEYIDHVVPSGGTYYIRVYYDDACNTYHLWWDDVSH